MEKFITIETSKSAQDYYLEFFKNCDLQDRLDKAPICVWLVITISTLIYLNLGFDINGLLSIIIGIVSVGLAHIQSKHSLQIENHLKDALSSATEAEKRHIEKILEDLPTCNVRNFVHWKAYKKSNEIDPADELSNFFTNEKNIQHLSILGLLSICIPIVLLGLADLVDISVSKTITNIIVAPFITLVIAFIFLGGPILNTINKKISTTKNDRRFISLISYFLYAISGVLIVSFFWRDAAIKGDLILDPRDGLDNNFKLNYIGSILYYIVLPTFVGFLYSKVLNMSTKGVKI